MTTRFMLVAAVALSLLCSGASVMAQSAGKGTTKPAATKERPTLTSVGEKTLAPYLDKVVKIDGIVGHYMKTKNRYRFTTDDGESVVVVGSFPAFAGARWKLTARVSRNGSVYELQEISKERLDGSSGSKGKIDPLLIAAGALLIVAAGIVVVMGIKSKAGARERELEMRLEEESRRNRQSNVGAAIGADLAGAGHTVVPDKPAKGAKQGTVVSIGSIEATSGPHSGQRFSLVHGENIIGRDSEKCTVVLSSDTEVSNVHGVLLLSMDGRLLYTDQSTNGSVVDGRPIHRQQTDVASGCEIAVGATVLRVSLRLGQASAAAAPPDHGAAGKIVVGESAPESPRRKPTMIGDRQDVPGVAATSIGYPAELEITDGGGSVRRHAISKPTTTMGRDLDRDIRLDDESVSRKHAELQFGEQGFWLRDSGSLHGTSVNGTRIPEDGVAVKNGDVIQLGKSPEMVRFLILDKEGD
jgi:pSer/pThr/pTyr-binding forkhead associated (FHA) protein